MILSVWNGQDRPSKDKKEVISCLGVGWGRRSWRQIWFVMVGMWDWSYNPEDYGSMTCTFLVGELYLSKAAFKMMYFSFKTSGKAMTPQSHRILSMIWPHTPNQFHLPILFTLCFMLRNSKLSHSPPCNPPVLHRIPTVKPQPHIPVLSQSWAKAPPPGIQCILHHSLMWNSEAQLWLLVYTHRLNRPTDTVAKSLVISTTWSQRVCESSTIMLLKPLDLMYTFDSQKAKAQAFECKEVSPTSLVKDKTAPVVVPSGPWK